MVRGPLGQARAAVEDLAYLGRIADVGREAPRERKGGQTSCRAVGWPLSQMG